MLSACFRGGGGKTEVFDLPGFGVLLAGIAFCIMSMNVCLQLKPDQDPMDHYAVKLFTHIHINVIIVIMFIN